ncbi:MAG: GAF domain-containing protein [Ignavibacteriota bacterium]
MAEETDREQGQPAENDAPRTVRRITFDDFEIERRAAEEESNALHPGFLKNAIPRIRSMKDDLLGGTGKKLFGAKAEPTDQHEEHTFAEPTLAIDPLSAPYFSDEERSLIRVKKIPKPNETAPRSSESPPAAGIPTIEEFEVDEPEQDSDIQPLSGFSESFGDTESSAFIDGTINVYIESPETLEEVVYDDEESPEEPEEIEQDPNVETANRVIPVASDVPEIRDPSIKVYLDSLRGFDSLPRRAGEAREPRRDFVMMLSELLELLREHVEAQSALFFWMNSRKQHLVLECASLDDFAFKYLIPERKYSIENDAVSKTAIRGEPQLIQRIAPQAEYDLIPYYTDVIGVRSFAAMPVFFGESLVAVVAVDSLNEDQFSAETLRLLTEYSRLISGLVRSYIETYDLLSSARTLESARKLHQLSTTDFSLRAPKDAERTAEYILRALSEAAGELIDWEWFATISFDVTQRAWGIHNLQAKASEPYIAPKTRIDLTESLIGKSLRTGKSERVDSLSQQSIRFSLEEDRTKAVGHSFLVIPIRTAQKNYGALAIEHSESARFTDVDIEAVEHLTRSAASALEILALSEIVHDRALTDILTGISNKRGFDERLGEELARAKEFDEPLSVILFEIDDIVQFAERFNQEDLDTIVLALTGVLQYLKQPYDVLARVGEYRFAVLLVKMTDEEAYLWSEKVRQKIVSEVIALGRKSFSITTSIGLAGARRNSTTDDILTSAKMALDKAKERGGNEVIVY